MLLHKIYFHSIILCVKGYISTADAALRLGITTTRVRQMIAEGVIREAEKFGRDYFIPESEIQRLEKSDRKPGRPVKVTDQTDPKTD